MRMMPIVAATLAVMSTAALAQTTPPRSSSTSAPSTTQSTKPAVNPLTQADVSKIEGTAVYGSDSSKIGHVSEVLMDPTNRKIDKLVVSAGTVLGMGGHRVALPLDQFAWDATDGGFKIEKTEANLKSMPEWTEGISGSTTATGSSVAPSKQPAPGAGDGKTR